MWKYHNPSVLQSDWDCIDLSNVFLHIPFNFQDLRFDYKGQSHERLFLYHHIL